MEVFVKTPKGLGIQDSFKFLGFEIDLMAKPIGEISTRKLKKVRRKLVDCRASDSWGYHLVQEELDVRDNLKPRL